MVHLHTWQISVGCWQEVLVLGWKDFSIVLREDLLMWQLTPAKADSPGEGQWKLCRLLWVSLGSQMPSFLGYPVLPQGSVLFIQGELHVGGEDHWGHLGSQLPD